MDAGNLLYVTGITWSPGLIMHGSTTGVAISVIPLTRDTDPTEINHR